MTQAPRLVAFSIERRSIGVAVFKGTELDYADVKQLSSEHQAAESGAVRFIHWILSSFNITSAAMERLDNESGTLRSQIHLTTEAILRGKGIAIYRIAKAELLAAFGHPPLKSRKELRTVITNMWPILEAQRQPGTKLDAVALALHCQTERLFQH